MGHHFIAVGTKGCRGTFLSAATTTAAPATVAAPAVAATTVATDAVLGHGREEVGIQFYDEIKLLALGFEFHV